MEQLLDKTELKAAIDKFPCEIRKISIDKVFPNKWNPNTQSDLVFNTLKQSVETVGFIYPVLVREVEKDLYYEIIDGEHKFRAAKDAGYTEILIADMGVVDEMLAKTLTLSLNRIHGSHDILKEAELLKQIKAGQGGLFNLLPMEQANIDAQIKLLDFDFGQYDTTYEEPDRSHVVNALETALKLEKTLRKIHAESNNTNLRLLLEQYFAWLKALQSNLK